MLTDICVRCEKPIYYGPRIRTQLNLKSRGEKIWRHTDTEHRKCAGRMPTAWPASDKRAP